MPKPKKIEIDPTALVAYSEVGRFLHDFLRKCSKRPQHHILRQGKTYEHHGRRFKLTHTLYRKVLDAGNELSPYEVMANPPEGENHAAKGGNASVDYSLGVLYPQLKDGLIFIPGDDGRVVKNILCTKNTDEDLEAQRMELNLELAHSRMGGKLWPKFLFTWQGDDRWGLLYSMRRARGRDLTTWLREEKNKSVADFHRLSKVSLALIQALYLQVTRYGIIHCDIKPDNIFIEEVNGEFSVTIIDYGYAMSQDKFNRPMPVQGTSDYLPRECKDAALRKLGQALHNEKFDVYSLGKVLEQVWSSASLAANHPLVKVLQAATADALDWDRADKEEPEKEKQFARAIQNLVAARPTMHELYQRVVDAVCPEKELAKANLIGLNTRQELDTLKKDDEFINKVEVSLRALRDAPAVIRAYINGLGWDALTFENIHRHPLQTKAELLDAIRRIQEKRYEAIRVVDEAVVKLQSNIEICRNNLDYFSHVESYLVIDAAFKALKEKYEKLKSKFERMPLDLDEISIKADRVLRELLSLTELHELLHFVPDKPGATPWVFPEDHKAYEAEATEALDQKVKKILALDPLRFSEKTRKKIKKLLENKKLSFDYKRARLVAYFSSGKYQRMYTEICLAEKRSPVYALESYFVLIRAIETKNSEEPGSAILSGLAQALRSYLAFAANDRSFHSLSRAASNARLSDIQKIASLIPHCSTDEAMVVGLKKVLAEMETGFFGRSLLRKKLNAVVKRYEGRKYTMPKKLKVIDVTKLNSIKDMRLIDLFLRRHVKKNKNGVIFADQEYSYHGRKLQFQHDMIYRGKKEAMDENSPEPPCFSVLRKGALSNRTDGLEVIMDVGGYLELMPNGTCFYERLSFSEVARFYGPDIDLKEKEMREQYQRDLAVIKEAYADKKTEPTVPRVHQMVGLVNYEKFDGGGAIEGRPECGFFVLQAGTTLKKYLLDNHHKLQDGDRLRLTHAILNAYKQQKINRDTIETYFDSDDIIISVDHDGQYKIDLIGSGLKKESNALNKPMFMNPKALKNRCKPFQFLFEAQDHRVGFNGSTDAWSVGRILCMVWDREDHSLAAQYDDCCKESYKKNYENYFEKIALKKIEEKRERRGFISRAWHAFTALFYSDKDNVKKIKYNLSRAECEAIQDQVTNEVIPCMVATTMNENMGEFAANLHAPKAIQRLLPDLLAGNSNGLSIDIPSFSRIDTTTLEKRQEKARQTLGRVNEASLKLLGNRHLFNGEHLPLAWKALQDFQAEVAAIFDNGEPIDRVDHCVQKFNFIKDYIALSAQRFDVRYATSGSADSKMLFAYLAEQVNKGVSFFEEGHLFLDEHGVTHQLSHALDVRRDGLNGSVRYDVLTLLSGPGGADNIHSAVSQVGYVLKPAVGGDSLMCVRKTGADEKYQQGRRLVKRNLAATESVKEAKEEFEQLEVFGTQFGVKNHHDASFNQKRQPGVPYSNHVNQDAKSDNDAFKRKRFLALVRAFYVQAELNRVHYTDLKPDNLILNVLPNGEDLFAIVDFEEKRCNPYSGMLPDNQQGRESPHNQLGRIIYKRQPLFGLGIVLAQLYCGLEIKDINLKTEKALSELMAKVETGIMPEPIRALINDLLSTDARPQIGNVAELLERAYVLCFGDESEARKKRDAYFSGCELKGMLLKLETKDEFIETINQALNRLGGEVSPGVLHEFIRGLGFASLLKEIDKLNTPQELNDKIALIFSYKVNVLNQWTKKKEALNNLVQARQVDETLLSDKQFALVNFALDEASIKVDRIHVHYDTLCDLDEISGAHTRLLGLSMSEFNRLHGTAIKLAEKLAPRTQTLLLKQAVVGGDDETKKACADALDGYAKTKGVLSTRRKRDIIALKEIIGTRNGEELKTALRDYVKGTLAGGLFGKSSLRKGALAASLLKVTKPAAGRG